MHTHNTHKYKIKSYRWKGYFFFSPIKKKQVVQDVYLTYFNNLNEQVFKLSM